MAGLNRRRVLRGILEGGAVSVALPLLNCFLDGNGTSLASGDPLPLRFGTWFWGLGMDKSIFVPKKIGAGFDLPEEIAALERVRGHINLFTNLTAFRDTTPNQCHFTGWAIMATGIAPESRQIMGESLDATISNRIGRTTRFKSLTATATGDVRTTFSYENAYSPNNAEASPLNFYTRLFGPGYQDPNTPTFTPNPRAMVRRSTLSAVTDERQELMKSVGAEDRARLDQFFTGLRHLEQQLDQQLTKPKPLAACHPAAAFTEDPKPGGDTALTAQRHNMMTDLMVMAVACDQTRVFNMSYSEASANTTKAGYEKPHHTTTHEERVDEKLGYQPTASWYLRRSMESWATYVEAFSKVSEGDGTLLDNLLIYGFTDHGLARSHSLDGLPAFTAGRAGGRVRTGLHVDGGGTAGTRLGYTAMKIMGLDTATWGTNSNQTSKEFGEILA